MRVVVVDCIAIRRKLNDAGTVCVTRAKATIERRTEERENGVNLLSNRNDDASSTVFYHFFFFLSDGLTSPSTPVV